MTDDFMKPDTIADRAAAYVIANEGGYVNDLTDPGGETNFGISKRSYPDLDIRALTKEAAAKIYKRDWWDKFGFHVLPPLVSIKVMDLAVNAGIRRAVRLLQEACAACQEPTSDPVGIMGTDTINAAHRVGDGRLMPVLVQEAKTYYMDLANVHPALGKFLKGWVARAERVPC